MWLKTFWVLLVVTALTACVDQQKTATMEDLYTREVRMPDGVRYRAEVASKPFDMSRGLMFRDSLAGDRAMLFVYGQAGRYPIWTYQNRIALDVIWLDQNRIINEIIPGLQPCKTDSANKCPQYGGAFRSLYVLETNAGVAAKHKLKPGDRLDF
ncbi:MAG: DUF192 domain-containing protein [Acidobacteria bacterium]|nr:DUF192 domain-containing protein [Acidobacteriota bacterium]